jgi:DUF4097 and DUF4098 domain-containing protein YvlB
MPVPPVAAGAIPAMPAPPVNPGFSSAPPMPPAPPSAPDQPEPPAPPAAPNQTVLFNGSNFGSGLSSFIEEVVDRVSSVFSDVVEPRYEFTYELTGEFAADTVDLRIQTGNGRAEVKTWDEPGYKAVILVKARGNNEDDARNRARDAYVVRSGANLFELESRRHDWHDIAVHVTLYVPKSKRYSLETRTGNGHVEVHDLQMLDARITTGNGRVVCIGTADRISMRSGNGSVEIEGDYADLEAQSGNGSVTVRPTGSRSQSYRLNTGNGSIRFDAAGLNGDAGFRVEGNTGMGGITVGMANLVYDRDIRTVGHKQIIARTPNYDIAAVKVNVTAKTGMGSISIG